MNRAAVSRGFSLFLDKCWLLASSGGVGGILLLSFERLTVSKNMTLNYNRTVYQLHTPRAAYALRHAKVEVRERYDGAVQILYKDKPLDYSIYRVPPRQAELIPSKELNAALDARHTPPKKRKVYVPPADHPWRKFKHGKATAE